ncbi:MAG: SDR family oxidoreductase [Proteobacteria bacterium]|nr:SDR family oxidoreductase [Pseudomonadota bacterium]
MSGIMDGKRGVIMGVANDKSIAWGIAQQLHAQGAELAFTYAGEALHKRITPLAASVGSNMVIECNVTNDDAINDAFATIGKSWGKIDFIVHAIAFADKEELRGRFVDTSRSNFALSMDISCYSFIAAARAALPLMNKGGSMVTLSYYGAEKVVPNYNVMGVAKAALEASVRYLAADLGVNDVRVNAISAGPIRTLAASGIGDFRKMLTYNAVNAPLGRNVTADEVGSNALYLLSPLSAGVTGEVIHVDGGYHVMGTSRDLSATAPATEA